MSRASSVGLVNRQQDTVEPPVVTVENLSKTFQRADGTTVGAIDDVSFSLQRGEMLVLLGPSGCGKTTLLRSIAGLETPDSGRITVRGVPVFDSSARRDLRPQDRRLQMVFQSYALWPHMTALQNVAYPLRCRGVAKGTAEERATEALTTVDILQVAGQHPANMSGGQQQRVALARALVADSDVILFDEPLSNVDAKVRDQLRVELMELQSRLSFSGIYVTHDQGEAMQLGHRIAVFRDGAIEQLDSPASVYCRPRSTYVARFIGSTNEFTGEVLSARDSAVEVQVAGLGAVTGQATSDDLEKGAPVAVIFRPEACTVTLDASAQSNSWSGEILRSVFVGSYTEHLVAVAETRLRVTSPGALRWEDGTRVTVSVQPAEVLVYPADS